MQSCVIEIFKAFEAFFCIKWFKLSLFARKLSIKHYFVYLILLKWWQSKTIVIRFKLYAKLRVSCFLSIFGVFSLTVVQTWFVWQEAWHTTLFWIYYCLEIVRVQDNSHMREITCGVSFLKFFKLFHTFSHKVVKTVFVVHETGHTTKFAIYYCVEMIRIKTIVIRLKLWLSCVFEVF